MATARWAMKLTIMAMTTTMATGGNDDDGNAAMGNGAMGYNDDDNVNG